MFSSLALLFLLLAAANCGKDKPVFSEDIQEIIDTVHGDCVGKTGVSEEDITNCELGIFKEDEKLKCYMFCILEEGTFVDDEREVDYDMLVSFVPEELQERTRKMLFPCIVHDTPDKTPCQSAYDVHKCIYERDPDVFSDEIQEIINTVHADCVTQTGVLEEDIQNCEKGIFKEDEKLKCYMVCLLEEASLVDEDQVDYDMLVSLMPDALQDRTRTMLFACKHLDTPDKYKCQRAFDVHKCTYEKDPDLYFLL